MLTIWGCISKLWDIGSRARSCHLRRVKLERKLDDPKLRDHPRYDEALERYNAVFEECKAFEQEAAPVIKIARDEYAILAPDNRKRFVRRGGLNEGWPTIDQPDLWAKALWYRARGGDPWPSGEPGF